jgi:hypothetical protein
MGSKLAGVIDFHYEHIVKAETQKCFLNRRKLELKHCLVDLYKDALPKVTQ